MLSIIFTTLLVLYHLWSDACLNIGITHHIIDELLIFFARLIADFVHITAIYRIFVRKNLIPVDRIFCINREILILIPESLVFVFFQISEHRAIIHVVAVDDVIIV